MPIFDNPHTPNALRNGKTMNQAPQDAIYRIRNDRLSSDPQWTSVICVSDRSKIIEGGRYRKSPIPHEDRPQSHTGKLRDMEGKRGSSENFCLSAPVAKSAENLASPESSVSPPPVKAFLWKPSHSWPIVRRDIKGIASEDLRGYWPKRIIVLVRFWVAAIVALPSGPPGSLWISRPVGPKFPGSHMDPSHRPGRNKRPNPCAHEEILYRFKRNGENVGPR